MSLVYDILKTVGTTNITPTTHDHTRHHECYCDNEMEIIFFLTRCTKFQNITLM